MVAGVGIIVFLIVFLIVAGRIGASHVDAVGNWNAEEIGIVISVAVCVLLGPRVRTGVSPSWRVRGMRGVCEG